MAKFAAPAGLPCRPHTCRASVIAPVAWRQALPAGGFTCISCLSHGWYCQFLEEDLKTPLPRKMTLKDPAKIFEIAGAELQDDP